MRQHTRFVGLDVHAKTVAIAVAEGGRDEPKFLRQVPSDLSRILKSLDRLGPRESLHCAYEAGPTGYGLQRALQDAGIRCDVIAPSKMPKQSGDRVKTDRKDAIRLAHFLRSGDLVAVHVPDEDCEAMRDLLRARDDAKRAQLRARHQLSKFLLRHGWRWPKSNWTKAHHEWVEQQRFEHAAQNRVLEEYLHTVNEATARIVRYDALLAELVPATELAPLIEALQAFRGIHRLRAVRPAALRVTEEADGLPRTHCERGLERRPRATRRYHEGRQQGVEAPTRRGGALLSTPATRSVPFEEASRGRRARCASDRVEGAGALEPALQVTVRPRQAAAEGARRARARARGLPLGRRPGADATDSLTKFT